MLGNGLSFDAEGGYPPEKETNHTPVLDNVDSPRATVAAWETSGFLSHIAGLAGYCNPMTVTIQYNSVTGAIKLRLC